MKEYLVKMQQAYGFKNAKIFFEGNDFIIAIVKTKNDIVYQLIIEEDNTEDLDDVQYLVTAYAAAGQGRWVEVETAEIF